MGGGFGGDEHFAACGGRVEGYDPEALDTQRPGLDSQRADRTLVLVWCQRHAVRKAPAPGRAAGLVGHHRMLCLLEVAQDVAAGGRLTAAGLPAHQASAQFHPRRTLVQARLARGRSIGRGRRDRDHEEVPA
jgi:hypothetical protein